MKQDRTKNLDEILINYKPYELDFVPPNSEGDVEVYLDLYLMYESKDKEWNEVQALIFNYFNDLLERYRSKKISDNYLLEMLNFPEVEVIGFGYCEKGTKGRGSHVERAKLLKKSIFDDPKINKFGLGHLAKTSILIPGIGPDLLSDMVANFALLNLVKYTEEQVKTFDLETMDVNIQRAYDPESKEWKPLIKKQLPYFKNGEQRVLVPRHIARKMPVFSREAFYATYLKYVLQDEEISRRRIVNVIGKEPKVTIGEIEEKLIREYESIGNATREIAKSEPTLIEKYVNNPNEYKHKRRPRKNKINWGKYIEELSHLEKGKDFSKKYALFLRKVFMAMYGSNLLRGRVETVSEGDVYRYDINFLNASDTEFFRAVRNQQIKSGLLIIEAKNYDKTKTGNKEFNQGISYSIKDGRELVFIIKREEIKESDIKKSKQIYLRQRVVVIPLSDSDLIKMLEMRNVSSESFDILLAARLQDILSA